MYIQLIMTNKNKSGNLFINARLPLTKLNFYTLGFFGGKKINSHVLNKILRVLALTCAYTHLCTCTCTCTQREKKRQNMKIEMGNDAVSHGQ